MATAAETNDGKEGPIPIHDLFKPGAVFEIEIEEELPPREFMVGPLALKDLIANRPKVDAPFVLAQLKVDLGFRKERRHRIIKDTIGFVRKRGAKEETYEQRLKKAMEQGKAEAASWGKIEINGHEATLFSMDWDFLVGTMGAAVGQTFFEAGDHAGKENELFIGVFSSAGARQDEGNPGLIQMPRMARIIDRFKSRKNNDAPYVAVLSGNVWGGIFASSAPLGDVVVALAGTDCGFAGRNVIEGYSGKKIPEEAQSVEAHLVHRNVDLLVDDEKHLVKWLSDFERLTHLARQKHHSQLEAGTPTIPMKNVVVELGKGDRRERLYEKFWDLRKNPDRPDGEFLIENVFDESVPLYSKVVTDTLIHYPGIIASLARIDQQVFMVIADQPSYQKRGETVVKVPSSPTPVDYEYAQRMLKLGERLGVPVISFVDTLGAKPTLEAEYAGQGRRIANSTSFFNSYKYPVMTYITGIGGSGGAVGTMGIFDSLCMGSDSQLYVAEPASAASIVYKTHKPTVDQIKDTIVSLRPTAQEQLERRLIDRVIQMPHYVVKRDIETTAAFRQDIIQNYPQLALLQRQGKLERRRDRRMKKMEGMPVTLHNPEE